MYTISDYTSYEEGKSRNGGGYAFFEEFEICDGKPVNGRHWTTAEFDYCQNCGTFERDMREHEERFGCTEYLPSDEAIKAVNMIVAFGFQIAAELFSAEGLSITEG